MFLAHSMGGLVVAKALVLAAAQPEKIEYMRIFECFAGGIFFGTPFRGSSAQARAVLLATFLEKVGKAIPTQMMQLLEPGRDSLDELRREFASLAFKDPKSTIACIYEQIKTNYLQEKVTQWVPPRPLLQARSGGDCCHRIVCDARWCCRARVRV